MKRRLSRFRREGFRRYIHMKKQTKATGTRTDTRKEAYTEAHTGKSTAARTGQRTEKRAGTHTGKYTGKRPGGYSKKYTRKRKQQRRKIFAAAAAICAAFAAAALFLFLTIKPSVALAGEKEETIEVLGTYKDPGAKATFWGKDISSSIESDGSVDTAKPGKYEITYTASIYGRKATATRTVRVVDTIAPAIELEGDTNMTLSSMDFFKEPGFSASDNYDGDLTASVRVTKHENKEQGTGTVTYEVFDSSGNQAESSREITIKDIVPPLMTLSGNSELTLAYGAEYVEQGAYAQDDLDGDISENIKTEGSVNTHIPGEQTVLYTAADAAGNTTTIRRSVHVLNKGEKNPNAIYLTFDDGPSDKVTPAVLKALKKYKIKATFFILNYSDENKHLIQQMIDEGHTVGIHGYSHDYAQIYKSEEAFMENVTKLAERIKKDFGYEPFVIRFPGGSSNTISRHYSEGIMTKLVRKVAEQGYGYLDWNVDSEDATGNNVAVKRLYENVKNGLKEKRDNVILMHDTNAKETTAKCLKKIVKYAKKNGYSFYAYKKDTPAVHHGVNN